MVLELKEYTMTSLSYKSLENPLISTKQTRPSPFYIKTRAPLLLSGLPLLRSSSSSPPLSLRIPAAEGVAAPTPFPLTTHT